MKKLITIVLFIAIFSVGMAQTVRRVNNIPGTSGTNVYTTAQAAHDAAVANDILIFDASSVSYGDLTLTKPLKMYGNGYFLNINTELKSDDRPSTLGTVWFNTGSGASEMYGITSSTVYVQGVSNLIVSRNNLGSFNIYTYNKANTVNTNVSNILFTRNYVSTISPSSSASGFSISSVLINNNIIYYISANSDPLVQSWVVRNNTITYPGAGVITLANGVFENNLLSGNSSATGVTFSNVSASYNVSTGTALITGIGNVSAFDVNADLLGATGNSPDKAFQIKAGSALLTMGSSSSQVGAFGGASPYIVSGIPAIPSIVSMINSGTGNSTTPIQVTISAKSNN